MEIWCEEEQNDVEKQRQNKMIFFFSEEAALSSFLNLRLIKNPATSSNKTIRRLMTFGRERMTYSPPELTLHSFVVTLIIPYLKNWQDSKAYNPLSSSLMWLKSRHALHLFFQCFRMEALQTDKGSISDKELSFCLNGNSKYIFHNTAQMLCSHKAAALRSCKRSVFLRICLRTF